MEVNFRQINSPEIIKGEEGTRKFTFVASDSTRDAAGTVLNPEKWNLDRFNKNGVIGYQHNVYGGSFGEDNPDNIIGKGFAYVKDGKLMVEVELEPADMNELADKIYKKLNFGSLKAVSVGFSPEGRGKWGEGAESRTGSNPTYYYAGQELLEVSIVNIPANPNALISKSVSEAMEAERKRLEAEDDGVKEKELKEKEQRRLEAERSMEMETILARAALL